MSGNKGRDDILLSETQVKEVIEHATRSEARSAQISIAELREIATELAIDPAALEQALEHVLTRPREPASKLSWLHAPTTRLGRLLDDVLPRRGRLVSSALIGVSTGWVSGAFSPGSEMDVPIGAALIALTLANSLSRRLDHRFRAFLSETTAMWGAFAVVWSGQYGSVTGDLLTWISINVIGAGLWGWFVIRQPGQRLPAPDLSPADSPSRLPSDQDRPDKTFRLIAPALIRLSRS